MTFVPSQFVPLGLIEHSRDRFPVAESSGGSIFTKGGTWTWKRAMNLKMEMTTVAGVLTAHSECHFRA